MTGSQHRNDDEAKSPYLIKPRRKVQLDRVSTVPEGVSEDKRIGKAELDHHRAELSSLPEVLHAEQKQTILVVLQGVDTSGKDSTISHIFSGINLQGRNVTSCKVPTPLEVRLDFLWRVHQNVPPRDINRSHYEDVLSPAVHGVISRKEARQRFDEINDSEKVRTLNRVLILKLQECAPVRDSLGLQVVPQPGDLAVAGRSDGGSEHEISQARSRPATVVLD